MTKNDLINDLDFRQKCDEYGLYWENANIYGDLILINTPIERLYVIFDKNYNTIGVEKSEYENEEQFLNEFYKRYSEFTDIMPFGNKFDYPFQNYTLKNFIDLANRVDIHENNQEYNVRTKINGQWYNRNFQNEEYFQLLSCIKFISKEIKMYFLQSYHMQAMGFEVPNIYSYIRALIKNLNASIDYQIENNQKPWPDAVLSSIGQNSSKLNFDSMLYDIIDLSMKQKGIKVRNANFDTLEQSDTSSKEKDLSNLADSLLRILDLSDEDLKKIEQTQHDELVQRQIESLRPWLNDDIDEGLDNGISLKKTTKNNK